MEAAKEIDICKHSRFIRLSRRPQSHRYVMVFLVGTLSAFRPDARRFESRHIIGMSVKNENTLQL